jgi:hypothetical protein
MLTPSALNQDPSRFDGREVVAVGWLSYDFEVRGLWDDNPDNAAPTPKGLRFNPYCVTPFIPERLRRTATRLRKQKVVVRARFRADFSEDYMAIAFCNLSALEVRSITKARE